MKPLVSAPYLLSLFLFACISPVRSETNNIGGKFQAAGPEEISLYRNIGTNYFCIARQAEVDFPKAIYIASKNFASIIYSKHGGLIKELGDEKLSIEMIYQGTSLQIIEGAIQLCPDKVPEDVVLEYKDNMEKLKNSKVIDKDE